MNPLTPNESQFVIGAAVTLGTILVYIIADFVKGMRKDQKQISADVSAMRVELMSNKKEIEAIDERLEKQETKMGEVEGRVHDVEKVLAGFRSK